MIERLIAKPKFESEKRAMDVTNQKAKNDESIVSCRNSQGVEIRATPVRMTRHLVVFEVYNPYSILQLSEVLQEFKIFINQRLVYSGRAVVSNLVNTGIFLVCEASLDDSWLDVDLFSPVDQQDRLKEEFGQFLAECKKADQVIPNFKLVVSDMQGFLVDFRRWMEQLEFAVRSHSNQDRQKVEEEVIGQLSEPALSTVDEFFRRFEAAAETVPQDLQPLHRAYVKRQLHPLVLCAPFSWRTFYKPLGYAGDYEMVNMMLRQPYEGSSMFAKVLNSFFLNFAPVLAHRNRIAFLSDSLKAEILRVHESGRRAQVFNLGCGPAQEIQRLLQEEEMSNHVDFTLLDFNEETLRSVKETLNQISEEKNRSIGLKTVLKSVHQMLREAARPGSGFKLNSYDVVYCAGLFDYLSDKVCKRLMGLFYRLLAPGGLLIATNVHANNPTRHWMEFVVDWHLVYRDDDQFRNLAPEGIDPKTAALSGDDTGVNIFMKVRKQE